MLALTEPGVHTVTLMCCTQLMKTALLENAFGYFAHLDPCPILLLQPKEDAAEQFSKERIAPMVRATPVLRGLVGSARTRNADETLLYKAFPGGFLALASAGSPDNLARRPIRILLCDEIDNYPPLASGDPIALAEERMASFGTNWLSIRACSPTIEGESRIEASYQASDQRRASVECPHCGHRQFLEFFSHVQWGKNGAGEHEPQTARIYCLACGAAWAEGQRLRALSTIRWHQTRPFACCGRLHRPLDAYAAAWQGGAAGDPVGAVWDWWEGDRWAVFRAKCPDCGRWGVDNAHAGFQASKLYSPWPRDAPDKIAAKWLAAKANEGLQLAWWNTQMGLPHLPSAGADVKPEGIAARGEVWPFQVPHGVAVLTVGADFQADRGEFEVVGWGRNEESWSISYDIIEGDPETDAFWQRVDAYLLQRWRGPYGREFRIDAACLDSGHHTERVYQFAKARLGRRIWAVKGESAQHGQRNPVWPPKRPSSRTKKSFRPIILGVNAAKDVIRGRLGLTEPGAGYMHFPADRDAGYFAQLTSERSITKQVGARRYRVWELPSGRANEALDCRVYAYAALSGLLHFGLALNRAVAAAMEAPATPQPQAAQSAPSPTQQPVDRQRPDGPRIIVEGEAAGGRFRGRLAGG